MWGERGGRLGRQGHGNSRKKEREKGREKDTSGEGREKGASRAGIGWVGGYNSILILYYGGLERSGSGAPLEGASIPSGYSGSGPR